MTNILLNGGINKQGLDNIHNEVKEQQQYYVRLLAKRGILKQHQRQNMDATIEELLRLELHTLDIQMKGSKSIIQRKKQQLQVLEKYEKK